MLVANTMYSFIRGDYDVQLASGAMASEVIWYHTCLESV